MANQLLKQRKRETNYNPDSTLDIKPIPQIGVSYNGWASTAAVQ